MELEQMSNDWRCGYCNKLLASGVNVTIPVHRCDYEDLLTARRHMIPDCAIQLVESLRAELAAEQEAHEETSKKVNHWQRRVYETWPILFQARWEIEALERDLEEERARLDYVLATSLGPASFIEGRQWDGSTSRDVIDRLIKEGGG